MSDLDCKKPVPCIPDNPPKEIYPPPTAPFDICVGDNTFTWDGTRATLNRVRRTPDGTYTSVTVVNGCIVGYGYADEPTYTPPYCNPNPTHCQTGGSSGSSGSGWNGVISPNVDNSIKLTSSGLYARTYIQGAGGISVVGTGTVTNPYIISGGSGAAGSGGVSAVVGRNGIETETTNGVVLAGLEEVGKPGVYDIGDQITIDRFGRVTDVTKRTDPIVAAGSGLTSRPDGDTLVIEHPKVNVDDRLILGGMSVAVNQTGHIVSNAREIKINSGVYNLGAYDVGLNSYGSVTSITQRSDIMPQDGSFTTSDGKTISYDITGRLTGIVDNNAGSGSGGIGVGGGSGTGMPLPIRDMYKVTINHDNDGGRGTYAITKDVYGTDVQMVAENFLLKVTLPGYVVNRNQIEVHGAREWTVDIMSNRLFVTTSPSIRVTIVFRG